MRNISDILEIPNANIIKIHSQMEHIYNRNIFLNKRFEEFYRKVMNRKKLQDYQKQHPILGHFLESLYKFAGKINQVP